MRRAVRTAAGLAAAILLAAIAGCANPENVASPLGTTATAATATSGQGTASAGSSVAIAPPPATTPAPAQPPSTATTGTCLAHVSVLYPGSDNPLRHTCVRVGGTVTITLTATGGYRWTAPTSAQLAVATVGDVRTDPDGTLHATVTTRAPGTTTLNATDSFTPDPHGPPSRLWTLILDIR